MKGILKTGIVLSASLLILGITVGSAVASAAISQRQSFMPENRLHLQDRLAGQSNITQEMFNSIIDSVSKVYAPIVAKHGARLTIDKRWTDSTVNAYAQQNGNVWNVAMFGGLARRPEVTPDGFALVVCHELGHHLGGYSFKGGRWAANEGQSDYFATQACARMVWGMQMDVNQSWRRLTDIPATVQTNCDAAWKNDNARGWCYRASAAGYSLANLLASLGQEKQISFDTPDKTVVSSTDDEHPAGQCRLDTYFQGALCTKGFNPDVIPGKSHSSGQQSVNAELEAAKYTCFAEDGYKLGIRPTCWFKSARPNKFRR